MLLTGYFLGGLVEQIMQSWFGIPNFKLEEHIDKVVIVVVFLSILPMIIEYLKHKFGKKEMIEATEN
jgi:membrane-associated protein